MLNWHNRILQGLENTFLVIPKPVLACRDKVSRGVNSFFESFEKHITAKQHLFWGVGRCALFGATLTVLFYAVFLALIAPPETFEQKQTRLNQMYQKVEQNRQRLYK